MRLITDPQGNSIMHVTWVSFTNNTMQPVTTIKQMRWSHTHTEIIFVAVFLGCTSTGRVDLCFLWFYVQELPKAQLVVVLVLKRLRRRGNGLKSHPTDWEKPGIEPATYSNRNTFCGFPWVETSTAGRVYDLCVYYMTGAPEGSLKVVLCGFMVLWRSRESNLRPLVYKA